MTVVSTRPNNNSNSSSSSSSSSSISRQVLFRRVSMMKNSSSTYVVTIASMLVIMMAFSLCANVYFLTTYERHLMSQQELPTLGNNVVISASNHDNNNRRLKDSFQIDNNNMNMNNTSGQSTFDNNNNNDNDNEPKLVWLMSFPNSGTSFTSRLVRDATKTDSASNYADETPSGQNGIKIPVYADQLDGPFWIQKPEELNNPILNEPEHYILTKTHCGIRCTMCPPEKYAESSYSFRRNCLKTKWLEVNGNTKKRVFSQYEPTNRLVKAVHLIRNPFDNIVSRYHLERKLPGRKASEYPKTREGFREYCKAIDGLHTANEKKVQFLDDDILDIMKNVPCHADFFRYIEWHNLAFITTNDLELDTYVLHYDWYMTRFNETATELFNFLQLDEIGDRTPFVEGKVYPYYTADEKRSVQKAFEIMSSPKTWLHVKQYFDNIDESTTHDENNAVALSESSSTGIDQRMMQQNQNNNNNNNNNIRPPLSSLVKDGSQTDIIGDVQFLMDFAIVGYPKTATSTKVRWLAQQDEIQMYDYEIYYMKDGQPADMVRKLYELPEGRQYKRGYKAPRDIHNPRALDSFAKYFPKTKLIIGLRHPVLWFESFYNYRVRNNFNLPQPHELIGTCTKEAANVCTEEVKYHDHLSRLGRTSRTDLNEIQLLSPLLPRYKNTPQLNNTIFLYEISQMHDTDKVRMAQYRKDLGEYLGLSKPLSPLTESEEEHDDDHPNKDKEIDICSIENEVIHTELMRIAKNASIWIRTYFLKEASNVYVSSPEHFNKLLEGWLIDPCETRRRTKNIVATTS